MTRKTNEMFINAGIVGFLLLLVILPGISLVLYLLGFGHGLAFGNETVSRLLKGLFYLLFFGSFISLVWLGIMPRALLKIVQSRTNGPYGYRDYLGEIKMVNRLASVGLWIEDPVDLQTKRDAK